MFINHLQLYKFSFLEIIFIYQISFFFKQSSNILKLLLKFYEKSLSLNKLAYSHIHIAKISSAKNSFFLTYDFQILKIRSIGLSGGLYVGKYNIFKKFPTFYLNTFDL